MIDRIDAVVLTTNDVDACNCFYVETLGMRLETSISVRDPDRDPIEFAGYQR